MVKNAKAKSKKSTPKKATTARPALKAKAAAKYDQPGAPWWKKIAAPSPKY